MAGRPKVLEDDHKIVAFRAERTVAEDMTKVAKEVGVSPSELLRTGLPVLLRAVLKTYREAKKEALRQLREERKLDFDKVKNVSELCSDDMERQLNKVLFEKIKEQQKKKSTAKRG